jgi:acylphosphatase
MFSRRHILSAVVLLGLGLCAAVPARGDEPEKKAKMVYYSGKVQGVGFRATAADIAKDYPVTGWVKNLPDGRVQLLVEGPEDAVDKFLKAVRTRWKDNIEKEKTEDQTVTGKFKSFDVVK